MTNEMIKKEFDVEYLVDMALDSLKDGDSIEDMLRWVLLSAKSDEWFEGKYPDKCSDKEYNGNEVVFYNIKTIGE
jgi:hypothetical protein